jgi:16S rRNA (uracil1498-N3)-methyltransferase
MRRIHLAHLSLGAINLPEKQAHYLRDVLRLNEGAPVEVFDASGQVGQARIVSSGQGGVTITIDDVRPATSPRLRLTIASAIPKGARADWMIEKLSELGADAFIPLIAVRSVVIPRDSNKSDRWARLASESARQSGRSDVMTLEPAAEVGKLVAEARNGDRLAWYLSTRDDARPLANQFSEAGPGACGGQGHALAALTLLVGPEGGWTPDEIAAFDGAQLPGVRLTATVLRVETAAVAAAAIICSLFR